MKCESEIISSFDSSCFDGKYITGDVDDGILISLDQLRNDAGEVKARKMMKH